MAGERVGVRDVAGVEVAGRQGEPAVVVELDLDRPLLAVDGGDGAAAAVGDLEAAVVAGAEDAVADGELDAGVEAEPVAAEPAFAVEEGAGDGVELGDVGAAVGDHRAAGEVAARGLPPVGNELRLRLDPVGGDRQPPVLGGVGEVVAAAPSRSRASARRSSSSRWRRLSWSSIAPLRSTIALNRPPGADGGKLGRVADEHRLPLRALDLEQDAGEGAGVGHRGLVDDEQAASRQTALLPCLGEEAVEGAAGHAGLGGEVRGGDAGGGGADRHVAVPPVGVGERGERGRLAGARLADDADDALRARRRGVHHLELLARRASAARSSATCSTVAGETVGTQTRRPGAASRSASRSWRSSSAVENEAGRPTVAAAIGAIWSIARKRSTRAEHRSVGAPWTCACAQAMTASAPVNVERVLGQPVGPGKPAPQPRVTSCSSSSRTTVRPSSRFSSRRPRPCSAARASHSSRIRGRSTGSLRSRVSIAATLAA